MTTGFGASDQVIEGEVYVGSQEHFYMEPQSCVAVPRGEDGEMDVFSSIQAATTLQVLCPIVNFVYHSCTFMFFCSILCQYLRAHMYPFK